MTRIFATNFWSQQDPVLSTVSPPPASTFSRAGTAYRHYPIGGETRLGEVGTDVLRCSWQRNPDTGLWIRGAHMEPDRTNLILNNGKFTPLWPSGTWRANNSSVADDAQVLPDGTLCDDNIFHEDGTAATFHRIYSNSITSANGTIYSYSAIIRAINRNVIWMVADQANFSSFFNVGTGYVGTQNGVRDCEIRHLGNGWYFCWFSFSATGSTLYAQFWAALDNENLGFDGLDQDDFYILWPQLEVGEFPSSRIDTAGAPVSRTQDSDYQVAAPLPDAKQGWLSTKVYITPHINSAEIPLLTLSDGGSAADRIRLAINTSQNLEVQSACSGGDTGLVETGSVMDGRTEGHDVYLTWRPGELCLAVDGVFGPSDHTVSIPDNLDQLNIHPSGAIVGDVQMGDKFSRVPWRFLAAA